MVGPTSTETNLETRMQIGFAIGTIIANQLKPILEMIEEILNAADIGDVVS